MAVDPKGKSVRTPRMTFIIWSGSTSSLLMHLTDFAMELVQKVWNFFLKVPNINEEVTQN